MPNSKIRIPDEIASEVLELASRCYADYLQSYSAVELVEAGAEVQIPAEFIQQAIRDVQAKQSHQLERQQQTRQQQRRWLALGAGLLVALGLWSSWTYNTLARATARVEAAWAQVENQQQRRADLIPKLVTITETYAHHQRSLITQLSQSRAAYQQAKTSEQKTDAIARMNRAIIEFQDTLAADSILQSSQLFINLQYELTGTENRLAIERMRYNQAVQEYNQTVQTLPNSLLAQPFGFQVKPFLNLSSNVD